jgi:hypothetical protein
MLAVSAVGVASAAPVAGVSGRWYGEGVEVDGVFTQYLIERRDDGTLKVESRTPQNCAAATRVFVDTGRWRFENGTLSTRIETMDGDKVDALDPEFDGRYSVTAVDADHATLVDEDTAIAWSMKRVPKDFTFPPAEPCVP